MTSSKVVFLSACILDKNLLPIYQKFLSNTLESASVTFCNGT